MSGVYESGRVPTKKIRNFAVSGRYRIDRTETTFKEGHFLVLVLLRS